MGSRFRVRLWEVDTSSGRGRGDLKAVIDDAKDIGGSEHANDGGEMFFTIPWNHPQIDEIEPLQRHYEISRLNRNGVYVPIFTGLVDDFEADANEVIVYGRDYLSLLETTISPANTSYSSEFIGDIIKDQLIRATSNTAEPNSRMEFITIGSIDQTTTTTTVLTSYQPRLPFIASLCDILMSDRSDVRSIIKVEPRSSGSPEFTFTENRGSDRLNVRLEYGGLINDFLYAPGYGDLRTRVNAIGQKREGATLLFSTQTYASESTYGWITEPRLFIDIIDQGALDRKTLREARTLGRVGRGVALAIRANQLAPWDGYDIADSLPVVINRGLAQVNGLYTLWGLEWIGYRNGSEDLFLNLLPKDE